MVVEVLAIAIGQAKEVKDIQIEWEEVKSVFADGMILYTENHKSLPRKILVLINEFVKSSRNKIQESVVFL